MYNDVLLKTVKGSYFFSTIERFTTGTAECGKPNLWVNFRYPEDGYDRLWPTCARGPPFLGSPTLEPRWVSENLPTNWTTYAEDNNVPPQVMTSALLCNSNITYLVDLASDSALDPASNLVNTDPVTEIYVIFYFALLDQASSPVLITIALDDEKYSAFNITHQPSRRGFFHAVNYNSTNIAFTGPSIFNAYEIYQQQDFVKSITDSSSVNVTNSLKANFNLTAWQGDPCTPVPYDWIVCDPPNFLPMTGWVSEVTEIQLSNLTNSDRLILLGTSTPYIPNLLSMSVTQSKIDSATFLSLVENFVFTALYLDFSSNIITSLPEEKVWVDAAIKRHDVPVGISLSYLNLSHNQLTRVPPLTGMLAYDMTVLDISYNLITGDFPGTSYITNLTYLETLNISNNFISGTFPQSLSTLNLPSLKILDISQNNFEGNFNMDFYSNLTGLLTYPGFPEAQLTVNASHNSFSGILNLTGWYESLRLIHGRTRPNDLNTTYDKTFNLTFSVTHNNIMGIIPSADQFQPLVEALRYNTYFTQSGVLLGENPYCANPAHFTQRYLCRTDVSEVVPADKKENYISIIMIVALVIVGIVIFMGFLISSLIIWRLWKQVHHLRQIHQELASRKVQPPYYSYRELRTGTSNFHDSNKLGSGTFGAVYKGKLQDGTTVAVKRLFHAKQKQVLEEFLNEVMLIIGIKHKNLVQLKGCCVENQERILVYEYAENGNVADAIWGENAPQILDWKSRFNICLGIAQGLSYLHEELQPRIVHRDVKPANVLLDGNFNAKIADFGTAKPFMDEKQDAHFTEVIAGTRGYFAPEYMTEGKLTTTADVYGFGVLALEIISGKRWYNIPPEQIHMISWAKDLQSKEASMEILDPTLRPYCDTQDEVTRAINIALMCVKMDPEQRPTMSEVEAMLLEGKKRSYPDMCTTLQEDNSYRLGSIYETLEMEYGQGRASTPSSTIGDPFKSTTSSLRLGSLAQGSEFQDSPLMWWSGTYPNRQRGYLHGLRRMTRSLSERIRR